MIAMRNETIETFEQGAFTAATGAGNKHQLASRQREGNIFDGRRLFKGLCARCWSSSSWFGVIFRAAVTKTEFISIHCRGCIGASCVVRMHGHECRLPFVFSCGVAQWGKIVSISSYRL